MLTISPGIVSPSDTRFEVVERHAQNFGRHSCSVVHGCTM